MRVVLDSEDPQGIPADRLTDVKLGLLRGLGGGASAVMLEPEYSAAQAISSQVLPGSVGFLAAIEAQGYLGDPTARQTSLLDGWGVEKAKRLGASGIKLLVLYRPDAGAITEGQDEMIAAVIADCARYDIPLFLEPLAYAIEPGLSPDSAEFAAKRRAIVIETAKRLGALGPEVLKVQFPVDTRLESDRTVWKEACSELDEASPVPWALLSGGDSYELFRDLEGSVRKLGNRVRITAQLIDANRGFQSWSCRYDPPDIDERWYLTY